MANNQMGSSTVLMSPTLQKEIAEVHITGTQNGVWGNAQGLKDQRWLINNVIKPYKIKSILDYGSGKGRMAQALRVAYPDILVDEYDPCVPGKDTLQSRNYDLVVCVRVLEHVEPEYLDATLARLAKLAYYAYLVPDTRPCGLTLCDGRNGHLSLHPSAVWYGKFDQYWTPLDCDTRSNGEFRYFGEAT